MGYQVCMDKNADTEGNYSLVGLRCKNRGFDYQCHGNSLDKPLLLGIIWKTYVQKYIRKF